MPVTMGGYEEALDTLGRCRIYIREGTLLASTNPLTEVTITEGAVRAVPVKNTQTLTLPEVAGETPIRARSQTVGITVTVPVLLTRSVLDLVNTRPSTSGQDDPTWGVLIVPEEQIGAGLSLTAGTWSPALPDRALFIFKATFSPLPYVYGFADVGKVVEEFTISGMFLTTNPSGFEVYAFGEEIENVTGLTI